MNDRTTRFLVEICTDTRRIEHACRSVEEANRLAATVKQIPEVLKCDLIETVGLAENPKYLRKNLFSRAMELSPK